MSFNYLLYICNHAKYLWSAQRLFQKTQVILGYTKTRSVVTGRYKVPGDHEQKAIHSVKGQLKKGIHSRVEKKSVLCWEGEKSLLGWNNSIWKDTGGWQHMLCWKKNGEESDLTGNRSCLGFIVLLCQWHRLCRYTTLLKPSNPFLMQWSK